MAPSVNAVEAAQSSTPRPHTSAQSAPRRKTRIGALTASVALVLGLGLALSAPAAADPDTSGGTVASVTAKLRDLSIEAEQLTEKFNGAQIDVDAKAAAAAAAQTAAAAAQANFVAARTALNGSIVDQYTSSSFNRTAALLQSNSGQQYLDQLELLNLLNARRAADITKLQNAKAAADTAQAQATTLLNEATKLRDDLATQKKDLDAKQAKYKAELDRLTAAERAAYFAAQQVAVTPTGETVVAPAPETPTAEILEVAAAPAPSGGAAAAVDAAMAQRGKPYVYASGGPNSFDCSGLTAFAWRAAGVSLPHNAAGQYSYGTHVSLDELQPGDLVFYYSPIGHVGLYIGGGMMVHAPTSGDVVKVASIYATGRPVGATRL